MDVATIAPMPVTVAAATPMAFFGCLPMLPHLSPSSSKMAPSRSSSSSVSASATSTASNSAFSPDSVSAPATASPSVDPTPVMPAAVAFAQALSPSASRRLRLASRTILLRAAADLVTAWRGWACAQRAKGLPISQPPTQVVQAYALLKKAREAITCAAADGVLPATVPSTSASASASGSASGSSLSQAVAQLPYPARLQPAAGLPAPKALRRRPAHTATSPFRGRSLKLSGASRRSAFQSLSHRR